jgi:hypothetical protein
MYSAALRGGTLHELAPSHMPAASVKTFLEARTSNIPDPQKELLDKIFGLQKAHKQRRSEALLKQLGEAKRRGDKHQERLLIEQLSEHHKTGR